MAKRNYVNKAALNVTDFVSTESKAPEAVEDVEAIKPKKSEDKQESSAEAKQPVKENTSDTNAIKTEENEVPETSSNTQAGSNGPIVKRKKTGTKTEKFSLLLTPIAKNNLEKYAEEYYCSKNDFINQLLENLDFYIK